MEIYRWLLLVPIYPYILAQVTQTIKACLPTYVLLHSVPLLLCRDYAIYLTDSITILTSTSLL